MTSKQYMSEFSQAVSRTEKEKYLLPIELREIVNVTSYRTNESYEDIYQLFIKNFGEADGTIDLTKVKGQCLNYHFQFSKILRKLFNVPTIMTIGYLTYRNKDMYKFENINSSLVRQLPNTNIQVIDIHAWLTFPTFEILDLTFMAHYAYVNSAPEMKEKLKKATDFPYYFGSAENLFTEDRIVYHPKYVGEDILRKNGFLNLFL